MRITLIDGKIIDVEFEWPDNIPPNGSILIFECDGATRCERFNASITIRTSANLGISVHNYRQSLSMRCSEMIFYRGNIKNKPSFPSALREGTHWISVHSDPAMDGKTGHVHRPKWLIQASGRKEKSHVVTDEINDFINSGDTRRSSATDSGFLKKVKKDLDFFPLF